jgi:thiamine biosynthesis protein ThiS
MAKLARGSPCCENPIWMNLTINGEIRALAPAETVAALVEQLGMKSDRVAIELNREIVSREQWAQTPLKDGDRLEIVHFVGGGSYQTFPPEPTLRPSD